ncbi:hypothetical protein ABEB36_003371 [Hypothenemus hampei]|uniref:MULE transposase domain-containing protein n=1 Tax=Hypothenemus hampei TaxID=57062 RepID=A0ABD1F9B7_HYPHA
MNSGQCEMLEKYGSDCICIDGTHGLNSYDFELHTLLVLDDMRQGFPCAFLLSNRSDKEVLTIFFEYVKLSAGNITPNVFMSDICESYFNAWLEVMSRPKLRLYCTWHIDRAWRKNLSKIGSKEKQADVYKQLRIILQETDSSAFHIMIQEFCTKNSSDPETIEFINYFKDNYLKNFKLWAYCCRLQAGLNTNMHIERIHRTIKYIYFRGRNIKRLDKCIHALMTFVRDKLFDRLIVLNKGKISSKLATIRSRHKTSLEMSLNLIVSVENGWQVASSNCNELYLIQEVDINCKCQLICTGCGDVCLHHYSCTCIDAAIKWNMCKHIHLVCKFRHEKDQPGINSNIGNNNIYNNFTFYRFKLFKFDFT